MVAHGLRWLVAVILLGSSIGSPVARAETSGQELYEKKCKLCHSIKGEGGKQAEKGGALDGVGARRDRAWLEKYLQDPKSMLPDSKMPKLKYTDDELKALVDFVLALK
jgi:cbb3-type cytochrome oxidase cytochrome c subunit